MEELLFIDFKTLKRFCVKEIFKVIILLFSLTIIFMMFHIPLYINFMYCSLVYLLLKKFNDNYDDEKINSSAIKHVFFNLLIIVAVAFFPNSNYILSLGFIYLLVYTYLITKELNIQKKSNNKSFDFLKTNSFINLCIYISLFFASLILWNIYDNIYGSMFRFSYGLLFFQVSLIFIILSLVSFFSLNRVAIIESNEKEQEEYKEQEEVKEVKEEEIKKEFEKDVSLCLADGELKIETNNLIGIKLISFFENSNLYFNSNFTLNDLSKCLKESKGVLSSVMNKDMNISFYTLMSIYRIKKAKQLLISQENITIESLALQCGFNSKSTFNKYFQRYVGLKPSEFRKFYSYNNECI